MNYSLVRVLPPEPIDCWMQPNRIKGRWVQDHAGGTLETAIAAAKRTEDANGNRLDIAVVASIGQIPNYDNLYNLERLDEKRIVKESSLNFSK